MVIRSVRPISCAKVAAVLYGGLGLIAGVIVALASMLGGLSPMETGSTVFGVIFGAGAIVLLPVFYAVMGGLVTLIGAWLYNVAAAAVGGVEIDVS